MTLYNINHFDTKNINPVTLLPVFGRPDGPEHFAENEKRYVYLLCWPNEETRLNDIVFQSIFAY